MTLVELFILAVGLSMDAFAVAICKGLSMQQINLKKAGIVGLYFGIFQAGMPVIGYLVGTQFKGSIMSIDHWVTFALLCFLGYKMIKESRDKPGCDSETSCENGDLSLGFTKMFALAVATSIDALAVGVTFAFLQVDIIPAASFIGVITLILSMVGVKIGHVVGAKFKSRAEFAGGLILILIGTKILLEHTGLINFA